MVMYAKYHRCRCGCREYFYTAAANFNIATYSVELSLKLIVILSLFQIASVLSDT